jgi:ABC-2 type transport system permease protein
MTSYILIVRSTTRRLLRRRRVLGTLILTAAPAPILFLLSWGRSDVEVFEMFHGLMITIASVLAFPIATIVIATAAFGEERKGHTMPFLVLKPIRRSVVAAAVTSAAATSAFVVIGIGVALTWLVAAGFTGEWTIGWAALVSAAVQALLSAAVFVPLGLLISRATLVGLVYLVLWETIIASAVAGVSASSTFRTALSAYADVANLPSDGRDGMTELLGQVTIGAGGAFAKAGVLMLISIALIALVLNKRDLAEE